MANLQNTNIFGTLDVKALTESNSTTTGALVVRGGVGIVGNLNLGGNLSLGNSSITAGKFNGLTIVSTSKTLDMSKASLTVGADGATGDITIKSSSPSTLTLSGSPTLKGTGEISLGANSLTLGKSLETTGTGKITLTGGGSASSTVTLPDKATMTLADLASNQTFTGIKTFTPTPRTSGTSPYFIVNSPADTGITASAESIGVSFSPSTRSWNKGDITAQREVLFGGPTILITGGGTVTTAINVDIAKPKAGTGTTLTKAWALRAENLLVSNEASIGGNLDLGGNFKVNNFFTISSSTETLRYDYSKTLNTASEIKIDKLESGSGLKIVSDASNINTTSDSYGLSVNRSGTYTPGRSAGVYGIHSLVDATGNAVEKTAGKLEVSGTGAKNTALYASASGGASNIALEVGAGDVVFNQLTASKALVLDDSKVVKSTAGSLTLNKNFKVSDGNIELVGVSGGSTLTLPATLTIGALPTAGNALYVESANKIGSETHLSVSRGGTGIGAFTENVIYKGGKKNIDENTTVDILIPSSISETIVENKKLITLGSDVFVDGSLTVEGSTIFIETENLQTKDKNIELGVPAEGEPASDESAHGGGITLRGTSEKTIAWAVTGENWTSSENWDLAEGKIYKINNKALLTPTVLSFHDSGNISTLDDKALYINSGGTGDLNVGTSGVKNITLGNKDGATNTTVRAGAGNLNLDATNVVVTNGKITIGEIESTPPVNVDLFSTTKEGNVDIATGLTSGKITIGGTSSTGISTLFPSTKGIVINLGSGATENAKIKSINIGASGLSGSTTNIVIGSATGTSNLTLNGAVTTGLNKGAVFVNNSGVLSSETALSVSRGGTGLSSVGENEILMGVKEGDSAIKLVSTSLSGDGGVDISFDGAKISFDTAQPIHTGATPRFTSLGLGVEKDNSNNLHLSSGTIKSSSTGGAIGFTLNTLDTLTGNLLDVKLGNTSKFTVNKDGDITSGGSVAGNASSATKLETERALWGIDFDGSKDISGSISGTGDITPENHDTSALGADDNRYKKAYLSKEVVIGNFTWQYNSTDESLDLIYSPASP